MLCFKTLYDIIAFVINICFRGIIMEIVAKRSNRLLFFAPLFAAFFMFVAFKGPQIVLDEYLKESGLTLENCKMLYGENFWDVYNAVTHSSETGLHVIYLASFILGLCMIYAFISRIICPRYPVVKDGSGFNLYMPFGKVWHIDFSEITDIYYRKNEDMMLRSKSLITPTIARGNRWRTSRRNAPFMANATMGTTKTGIVMVATPTGHFAVKSVKNALSVAQKMQVIVNDEKRIMNDIMSKSVRSKGGEVI